MTDKIKEYIGEAAAFSTQNASELEAFRIKFLGNKGLLKEFFAEFKNVPNDQKKRVWTGYQFIENYGRRES